MTLVAIPLAGVQDSPEALKLPVPKTIELISTPLVSVRVKLVSVIEALSSFVGAVMDIFGRVVSIVISRLAEAGLTWLLGSVSVYVIE